MIKQPDVRHSFVNEADELNYLNDMISFLSQNRMESASNLESLVHRFHELLARAGSDDGSIVLQDHWALLHEVKGRMAQAIPHRECEVERIERLFSIGGPIGPVNLEFLIECMRSLYRDYLATGNTEKAISIRDRILALDSAEE
jgi:hypothetical protein